MRSDPKYPYPVNPIGLRLKFCIHVDAFRASPRAYLTALWWRLRRKKLRAHTQFAQLLGGSPRAYDLWMLWKEDQTVADGRQTEDPPIVALVDATDRLEKLEETFNNLAAEGIAWLTIGTPDIPSLAAAAPHIDWSRKPWFLTISAGDRIARGAAGTYRAAIQGAGAQIAYADDDLLNNADHRCAPHFKPDWNKELFSHFDFLSGACILKISRTEMEKMGESSDWVRQLVEGKLTERMPLHVKKILHHRRKRPSPAYS